MAKFYYVVVDDENSKETAAAVKFLTEKQPQLNILLLKDSYFGKGPKRRNLNFISEFSTDSKDRVGSLSRYFILNNKGTTILTTSYKDRLQSGPWQDNTDFLNRLIFPVISK